MSGYLPDGCTQEDCDRATAQDAKFQAERLVAEIQRLREICFQAWWAFKVLRGQRPDSPDWTEAQRKAMRELDRLIELTYSGKASQ